jgi:DNA mismatch endonuclease (patch repair protein)
MSAVRGKRNKTTELALRMALVRSGIGGWVLHQKMLGCPDFYFPKARLAVFVDGCFWHGCHKCGHVPATNNSYWAAKLRRNRERDVATNEKLRAAGVAVIRFWEHELRRSIGGCLAKIQSSVT